MKISKIEILNFRSLKNISIFPQSILALVGRNNSGKSNILNALQLFFDGGVKTVNVETFYNHDTEQPINIFITFENLTDWEKEQFKAWMDEDKLIVGRRIISTGVDSFSVSTLAIKSFPTVEWLIEDKINGNNINEWWENKDDLKIEELNFGDFLGEARPNVGQWKKKAKEFINDNMGQIPFAQQEIENPKGYPGVLKGALPEFIYVPAVRNVLDEAKVSKTNPFGQLIHSILEKISEEQKSTISVGIIEIEKLLNRGTESRIAEIREIEIKLNRLMNELMDCDIEIEMSLPKLKEVFGATAIYANDGIRTKIETKGHGFQRSMIFTILRAYAELSHIIKAGEQANQRTTLFAIEEPELYLHPQLQRTLAGVFREISLGQDQIFYSTQSNLFIDMAHFDEICIMRREKHNNEFKSFPTQLTVKALIDDLKARKGVDATEIGIREQYAHVFDPSINEGFFADKVLIVEGPSEQYSLPIYSALTGYDLDRNNISIVHADGKGPMDRLLRIFNGFKIPTYLLFDGDKLNTDNEIKDKTLELLSLLGEPLENIDLLQTKVGEKHTVLEQFYEKTLQDEIDDYEEIIQEANSLLGPTGKPLKHRYLALKAKTKVKNGAPIENAVPETIIKLITKIKELSYSESILQTLE